MKHDEWAKQEGIHYMTAWRWWRDGKLPVPAYQAPSGTIIVDIPERSTAHAVVYARVSSSGQAEDLDRQVARVIAWAAVLTAFCARLYGRRDARQRALVALQTAKRGA